MFGLGAWWETPLYTERELAAALALTDAVTRLGDRGVSAITMQTLVVRVAAVAWLIDAAPHVVYDVRHLDVYDTSDKIGNVVSLGLPGALPAVRGTGGGGMRRGSGGGRSAPTTGRRRWGRDGR